tara:strand:+ start:193 stop:615 length:423 start_codon:yes stop_codon:yes gene_type:complete
MSKPPHEPAITDSSDVPRDQVTIVLVDDEALILSLGAEMLQHLGYQVLSANSPEKAIRLAESHNGTVDLLVTDVVMPDMDGKELADIMCKRFPSLKVIFMSGYTSEEIASQGVTTGDVHFMQKPFAVADLGAKVREVLTL